MKYIKDMTMCTKDCSEFITEINTPATITIDCEYEYNGFCLNSDCDCVFFDILDSKNADMLNNNKINKVKNDK